ncbi:hypothetical protein FRC08_016230, partial [Ceratobasidium sp. 394]
MEDEMLTSTCSLLFRDGVIAQWSSVLSDSYMPLQLDIVQLPSLNTGSDLKQWRLIEHELYIRQCDIEPACDLLVLLVLLEYQCASNRYGIHFRTLSTNDTHPDAIVEYLDCGIYPWGFRVECLGDIVVAYLPSTRANGQTFGEDGIEPLIYNWTTGALLDLSKRPLPRWLGVISKDVVVVPRSSFTYGSRDDPMGYLDIYLIDWSCSPSMALVMTLELPVIHSVPTPTTGLHGITDDSRAFCFHLSVGAGLRSSGSKADTRGLPQIFGPTKANRLLRLHISLPYTGGASLRRQPAFSSLYIPTGVIYGALKLHASGSPFYRVPWEHWSPGARWIHGPLNNVAAYSGYRHPGSRCILFQRDQDTAQITKFYVLDFNPHFLKDLEHRRSEPSSNTTDHTTVPTKWTYQPPEINVVSPTGSNAEPYTWLADSDADRAIAPYAWSLIQNEELYRVMEQGVRNILFDAEHIVVVQ